MSSKAELAQPEDDGGNEFYHCYSTVFLPEEHYG